MPSDARNIGTHLYGGLLHAIGQIAYLVGDDCESPTMFTGTGRFDGGIQRKQIRFVGNLLDSRDDMVDLLNLF